MTRLARLARYVSVALVHSISRMSGELAMVHLHSTTTIFLTGFRFLQSSEVCSDALVLPMLFKVTLWCCDIQQGRKNAR